MKYKPNFWIIVLVIGFSLVPNWLFAAQVETRFGNRVGNVIVRQFDEKYVITILGSDKKIFQYYGEDVKSIQASEPTLIGEKCLLRSEPKEESQAVINEPLVSGLEVVILSDPDQSEWLRVRIWGGHEGWIPKAVLTEQVDVFSAPMTKPDPLFGEDHSVTNATAAASIPEGTAAVDIKSTTPE